jgi:glycosyltransferase involved in cell wall biosynthesis
MTLLSIIVPNYNYAHFIESALDSILLTNTSADFEILVIDDASTDHSKEILKKYAHHPRLRILYNSHNLGVAQTMNNAIVQAKGEYLHFFASDDLHLPGTIDLMLAMIRTHPTVALFCSNHSYFISPEQIHSNPLLPCATFQYFDPTMTKTLFTHTDFSIPGHTLFVSKAIHLQYGPFDPNMGPLCDWLINHQIALNHGVGYVPYNLVAIREHPYSYNRSMKLKDKRRLWLLLFQLCKNNPSLNQLAKTGFFRMLGLRSIYKDLLFNPFYWQYAFPILRKELEKKCFHIFDLKRESFWLRDQVNFKHLTK